MVTKLGPIAASFAGSAIITRDAPNWSGTIVGAGTDSGSGSRTKGEIAYRLGSVDQDVATRVEVTVLYNLQGALAQFSRSGLTQAFARQLIAQFFQERFRHFRLFERLRSLWNLSLSEWRLPPKRSFFAARSAVQSAKTGLSRSRAQRRSSAR
jgi:hypothetical protein